MARKASQSKASAQHLSVAPFLGPAPIIEGESVDDYDELVDRISKSLQPQSAMEEIQAVQVADLFWECLRIRRLTNAFLCSQSETGLAILLRRLLGADEGRSLTRDWAKGDKETVRYINKLFDGGEVSKDEMMGETLTANLLTVRSLEALLAGKEQRLSKVIRDIEQGRFLRSRYVAPAIIEALPEAMAEE